jgi:hypothetical protein
VKRTPFCTNFLSNNGYDYTFSLRGYQEDDEKPLRESPDVSLEYD